MSQILDVKDEVWQLLKKEGPLSIVAITSRVNRSRNIVYISLGWLESEGKLRRTNTRQGTLFSVK